MIKCDPPLISFFLEYLSQELYASLERQLLLVSGAESQLLTFLDEDSVMQIVGQRQMADKDLLLFVVTDHGCEDSAGGTHWTLLAYDKADNCFRHYNSAGGISNRQADGLVRAIIPGLRRFGLSPPIQIIQADTPKQENGYDCGAYVLAFAESLCEHLASGRKGTVDLSNITPGYITQFRRRLHDIILQKAELYKSKQQSA